MLAGPAYAHDSVTATLTPSTNAPGGEVSVKASDCEGTTGAAKSEVFVADAELGGGGGKAVPLFGETQIRSTATAGTYDVTITCDGHDHPRAGTITIVHRNVHPTAPVRAGGGGTALAAESDGPGTPHTLIGLGLAGAAAIAIAGRSVRKRRNGSH
ncbi:hypothetical protein OG897_05830 [Streptomyces sp. NBC_00237]|uniref:hypothetical protein n=1 Tax=Streptomyces sp. NBC_00237 TaxID=2975687 RepID=UPI00225B3C02|nr:hypothetical protein [Streptomyces sp. NBC_00237]MCX5200982.1 hypothetical protein [Streptomyces sp. NBC_00237]